MLPYSHRSGKCTTMQADQRDWYRFHLLLPAAQRVQMQLQSAEQAEKDDSSPVTIADYGAFAGRHRLAHPTGS